MQNRENVKYTLLIFFIHGEAAAPHLRDLADDEEAVRVDGVDQLFQAGKLPAGDDAQQHGAGDCRGPFCAYGLVLTALVEQPVKPLAYVVCHHFCCDGCQKSCKFFAHWSHLLSCQLL